MSLWKPKTDAAAATAEIPTAVQPRREGTYVDATTEFRGSLKLKGNVALDGTIEGDVVCSGTVRIGASGHITGEIRADSVVIDGEVHGDLHVQSEITLHKSARVFGDMTTQGIVIEKGAKVEGRITIGTASPATQPAEKRPPASNGPNPTAR
jgi:cytoskeletal protein CcmA (bactofilin family)